MTIEQSKEIQKLLLNRLVNFIEVFLQIKRTFK